MPSNYYPSGNAEFLIWLENFITVADANKAAFGFTAADIAELQAFRDELTQKVNDKTAKQEAAKASVTAMNQTRRAVNEKIGVHNKVLKTNKTLDASLLESLGLTVNGANSTPIVPVAPTDLFVEGRSNGINYLRFKRSGNKAAVNFIIEAKIGAATQFIFVTVTKKTRFEHKNQTPGVRVVYRVKAMHGDSESTYSNDAIVYNNE
ncbi:MAG TPA: hypothetical protein VF604_01370 [Pyrinomonadaceae bacterium]|jgi:hypothetical protein